MYYFEKKLRPIYRFAKRAGLEYKLKEEVMMAKIEFKGFAGVLTPSTNEEWKANKATIRETLKAADIEHPLDVKCKTCLATGGIGVAYLDGSEWKCIGTIMKKDLPFSSSAAEVDEMVQSDAYTPYLCGVVGKYVVVGFAEKNSDEETEILCSEGIGSIADERQNAIDRGMSPLGVDERIKYLKENNISDGMIAELLTLLAPCDDVEGGEVAKPVALRQEPAGQIDQFGNPATPKLEALLLNILEHIHTILDGPMGCGKNVLLETKDWLLNVPSYSSTMKPDSTTESLLGMFITDNSPIQIPQDVKDALSKGFIWKHIFAVLETLANLCAKVMKPSVVFNPGFVVKALETPRAHLNFDEVNLGPAGVVAGVLNTLADGHSPYMYVEGYGKVPIRKDLIITATMNGMDCDYAGTLPLNDATKSRLDIIRFENPTESIAPIIRGAHPMASATTIDTVDKVYCHIRSLYQSGVITDAQALNMRGAKRMVQKMTRGQSLYHALKLSILGGVQNDDADVIVTELVSKGLLSDVVTNHIEDNGLPTIL